MYTVTRQMQWPDGEKIVEISLGGLDYANPDTLVAKYPGEIETYADPREAVEVAIEIAQAWQADCPNDEILIDYGATGGMTIPFDGRELDDITFQELREWAKQRFDATPKCDRCDEPLPDNERDWYRMADDWSGERFCSSDCAERAYRDNERFNHEFREQEAEAVINDMSREDCLGYITANYLDPDIEGDESLAELRQMVKENMLYHEGIE